MDRNQAAEIAKRMDAEYQNNEGQGKIAQAIVWAGWIVGEAIKEAGSSREATMEDEG